MIKAILFDLDGTLIHAKEIHRVALNRTLLSFGIPEISMDDHVTKFDGLPTKTKLKMLDIDEGLHSSINAHKQEVTLEEIDKQLAPDPVFLSSLTSLRRFYTLGCVTNSVSITAHRMLFRTGLLPFMKVVITNQDVSHPKPDPEPYAKACSVLGIQPEEALCLEDNLYGQQSVVNAGCLLLPVRDPDDFSVGNIIAYIQAYEGMHKSWNTMQSLISTSSQ